MAIPSKPTGLDTQGKLLYEIIVKLDKLTKVLSKAIPTTTTTTTTIAP